jgi:hypothetical protein
VTVSPTSGKAYCLGAFSVTMHQPASGHSSCVSVRGAVVCGSACLRVVGVLGPASPCAGTCRAHCRVAIGAAVVRKASHHSPVGRGVCINAVERLCAARSCPSDAVMGGSQAAASTSWCHAATIRPHAVGTCIGRCSAVNIKKLSCCSIQLHLAAVTRSLWSSLHC